LNGFLWKPLAHDRQAARKHLHGGKGSIARGSMAFS
jgi:hypothetical protein